ncbi:MAG: acyl-CoA dehydrogenase [Chloroflexi bacterium]|nr:MAG: acyl-CoA dehydrogenase [Chloroflexota bacterium]
MPVEAARRPATLDERIVEYVESVVRPQAAQMARGDEQRFPRYVIEEAGRLGLCGLLVPKVHGGSAGTHLDFARLIEATACACASTAVILDVQASVAIEPLVQFGSEDQRRRYLPRLTRGEWLGAFALSEPGSGSDAASLQTRAEHIDAGYRLTGTKMWITNAGAADLYLVMARTGGEGARGISAFLVEAERPGVRPGRPLRKLGLRGSWTAELHLDGVEVPAGNLLGAEGAGFRIAMTALDSGRIGISAQAVGIAQGALDVAVERIRSSGDRAVGDLDLLMATDAALRFAATGPLADMEAQVASSRQLTHHAAALCDAGRPFTREAAVAKLWSTEACVAVASTAVDLCAPDSTDEWHPAAVRLRDARACTIYEGTSQVQRMVIARELLRA